MVGSLLFASCMSYKQIEPGEVSDYGQIRITTNLGYQEFLWAPQVQADTLIGRRSSGNTLRVRLNNIRQIEASVMDGAKTAALVGGIVATAFLAYVVIIAKSIAASAR